MAPLATDWPKESSSSAMISLWCCNMVSRRRDGHVGRSMAWQVYENVSKYMSTDMQPMQSPPK